MNQLERETKRKFQRFWSVHSIQKLDHLFTLPVSFLFVVRSIFKTSINFRSANNAFCDSIMDHLTLRISFLPRKPTPKVLSFRLSFTQIITGSISSQWKWADSTASHLPRGYSKTLDQAYFFSTNLQGQMVPSPQLALSHLSQPSGF